VVELGERIHDLNLVPINQGGCSLIFAYFARFPLSYEHHPEQVEDMIGFNEMKVIFFLSLSEVISILPCFYPRSVGQNPTYHESVEYCSSTRKICKYKHTALALTTQNTYSHPSLVAILIQDDVSYARYVYLY
jgi:hypothetical protein